MNNNSEEFLKEGDFNEEKEIYLKSQTIDN